MQVFKNVSLKPYNTFGIDQSCEYYVELSDINELATLTGRDDLPSVRSILGGGSNILLTNPVKGLVIRNSLKGIEVLEENEEHTWLEVAAGEVWHDLVMHTIDHNLGGLENLSLIPGCVGAAPMQNIGAYGVEVKDKIEEVRAWHWQEKKFISLKNEDCRFGYRESIFKHALKGEVLITSVVFRLDKIHCLNTSYGAIREQLASMGVSEPSIRTVSDAVITIRSSKLPDPKHIGNAGSFFKNPTVSRQQFEDLLQHYPALPSYPAGESLVKLPAGWLIEQAGWKGYREDDAGVHAKQALVLVNYGQATGEQIWQLSEQILNSVKEKFGVLIEREVNIW